MDRRGFRFGEWQVDVAGNTLRCGNANVSLEPRAMDVLRYLCRHPGAVIPAEELLQMCWGTTELGDNPVHKAIAQLRRALGDSSTEPRYIETVRKRGYRAIGEIEEAREAQGWHAGSPFRGLEAFQENHAAIFFGRTEASGRLRDTVLKQASGGCPMTLVLGPSGSGKTSLVRAGLLPQLMACAAAGAAACAAAGAAAAAAAPADPGIALACVLHMDCADLAGSGLFGALAAVLVDAELDGRMLFEGSSADTLGRRLRDDPDAVAARLPETSPVRLALFIDRLEAIFRAPDTLDADRARFVQALERLARGGVLVVLACRNDFYPALVSLPELMALKARGGHFDLEPPGGADIAQMVRQPARAAQLTFGIESASGARLDDVLCDAARASPDALPLLQYCLDELYRQRGDGSELRFDVFRQLGGIEGALGVRAEQIVATLPSAQQAALPHVLSLLLHLDEEQAAVTARRAQWSALGNEAERELVRALVEARLFVSELAGGVPSFGVAHEALLRRWPRVVEWVERHRQALQLRTRVAAQARRWVAAGRPRDLLLPAGMQTNQARGLLDIADLSLSDEEQQYVAASLRRARLGSQIRMGVMTAITVLALLAGALGLTARSAQREAEQRRADAEGLMGFMLGDFVDKLRPLGRLDLLDDISARALAYLGKSDTDNGDRERMEHKAGTLQLIAELSIARGKPAVAKKALLEARQILEAQLRKAPDDLKLLKALGANAFWQGKISMDRGDWADARGHMDRYYRSASRMVQMAPSNGEARQELVYALNNQGTVAFRAEDYAGAAQAFTQAVELKKQLLARTPGDDTLTIDVANSLSWLARARAACGELIDGRAMHAQVRELLVPLRRKNPANGSWSHRLASAMGAQAELEQALGNAVAASQLLEAAVALMEAILRDDPSNAAWHSEVAQLQRSRLQALGASGKFVSLTEWRQLQERIARARAADSAGPGLLKVCLSTDAAVAEYLLASGAPAEARAEVERVQQSWRALLAGRNDDATSRARVAQALVVDAQARRMQGLPAKAEAACEEARQVLAPLRDKSGDFLILASIVQAHACSGNTAGARREQAALARMHFRDARYLRYLSIP